jgi:threonyl-tRNA synthetase
MSNLVDHKEIGRKLKLFSFSKKVPGTCYWWPKGALLFDLIVSDLKKELKEQGYLDLKTAPIIDLDTLKASGHYDNFREKLFFTGNENEMKKNKVNWCLKPMSCPGSVKIFNEEMRSYRDLPIKFSEMGTVFRYEQPGEVNGLLRTRVITQDDAHIYCLTDQIEPELLKLIDFVQKTYKRYGFDEIRVELSTRPEKSIGSDEQWQKAEAGLVKALKDAGIKCKENKGEGAFYGPKIDFHIKDSMGRSWQMGTIQLDFATAERLDANYIDKDGSKKHPVMIHRAILGSIERFIAVLLEHTAGALPFWLSPVQISILPIASRHLKYAQKIRDRIKDKEFRCEIDERDETLEKKIRDAEIQKIPYVLVVGDREVKAKKVALRSREKGDEGEIALESFLTAISRM